MDIDRPGHIAVVAHDAGAAAHIFAWLDTGLLNIDHCKFCLGGPAAKSFQIRQPEIELVSLKNVLKGAQIVLTGTGWSSSLEHEARGIAKKNGIKSIAVIDHWVNYVERFVREDVQILPDIIWVSDKFAYQKAKSLFPDIEIIEKRNDYIESQVDEVLSYKVDKQDSINVLYLLEPIRDEWAGKDIAGEFQALNFFLGVNTHFEFREKVFHYFEASSL